MKNINVSITLYQLNELDEKARGKAIEEHRHFQLERMQPEDFISGDPEYDTPEKLKETYAAEYNYYLFEDEPIIENIEANEYLYFADGSMASVTQYCGKHPLSGKTFFTFQGVEYDITK